MKPETTPSLLEQVCRIITNDGKIVYDDKHWKEVWEWHNNLEYIRFGGPWSTIAAAEQIIELVRANARI